MFEVPRMKVQKTHWPRPGDIDSAWWVVDATDLPLGRLASEVARILRGKHKPIFTPHLDVGDFVIVINADKVAVTGSKSTQKQYFRHSGYPGGLTAEGFAELLERQPGRVIERAVRGMLPKNRLGRRMIGKLKVYAGPDHPHQAQRPKPFEVDARKVLP
ncbi:MAG: 50S ribosomal protein L13 [Acidimicrobiia bacterium]